MDALSEVLRVLHLNSGIFLEADFTAPWCVDSAPDRGAGSPFRDTDHIAIYHLLTEGSCRVKLIGGDEIIDLKAGDLILLTQGDPHLLGSDLHRAPVGYKTLVEPSPTGGLERINHGGGGLRTRFVCGFLACDKRLCKPLLGALPRMLRVPLGDDPESNWILANVQRGAAETHSPRPGSAAMLGRLAELVFVEAMRHYIQSLPESQKGWLAGLRDPYIGKALALLHADPARDWKVESLAAEVGLSKTALNDRFVALIGDPPMQYLTGWRMALASQMLSASSDGVARIAERVGYDSEAAFNRAFKREFGSPPAAWRRSVREARSA